MKAAVLPALLLLLCTTSCGVHRNQPAVQYEYLRFERWVGTPIDFRVYPGTSRSTVVLFVSSYHGQTVDKRYTLPINDELSDAFGDYYRCLNGDQRVDEKNSVTIPPPSPRPSVYFVAGDREIPVTNNALLQRFLLFEYALKARLEQP